MGAAIMDRAARAALQCCRRLRRAMRLRHACRAARSRAEVPTGYPEDELAAWAKGAKEWVAKSDKHEAFVFFINGAKERAPAAAQAFLKMLS